jgi:hypothetical protein
VAARVQDFVDAGARHIIFAITCRDDRLAMMRRILDEVAPQVLVTAA